MNCTSTPTVVCELSRIADSLANKTPTTFEVWQFWVSLVAAIATLVVSGAATYVAYRAHRLAKAAHEDAISLRVQSGRREFRDEVVATIDAETDAVLFGDANAKWAARTKVQNVITQAAASGDASQEALAAAVREFADRLEGMSPEERGRLGRGEVAAIKTRAVAWLLYPDLPASAPAGYWEQLAKDAPEAAGDPSHPGSD